MSHEIPIRPAGLHLSTSNVFTLVFCLIVQVFGLWVLLLRSNHARGYYNYRRNTEQKLADLRTFIFQDKQCGCKQDDEDAQDIIYC